MLGPLIPSLCYENAPAAIEWLAAAFGFEAKLVVPGPEEGAVAHAQLVCQEPPCMVMLFSRRDDDYGTLQRPPRDLGACTQGLYMIVGDVQGHHDRAAAAGAEIVMPVTKQDYGGSGYTCTDLEGHVWSFGDYDPRG